MPSGQNLQNEEDGGGWTRTANGERRETFSGSTYNPIAYFNTLNVATGN